MLARSSFHRHCHLSTNIVFTVQYYEQLYCHQLLTPVQVWEGVLAHSSVGDLVQCSASLVTPWLCLLVAPSSAPVETSLLVPPSHTAQVGLLLDHSQIVLALWYQMNRGGFALIGGWLRG